MSKTPITNLCEEKTFDSFYRKHINDAFRFAFYKSGSEAQSHDLAQEAFAKIWENCSKIDFAKAKTYLITTVNNLFLNVVKHEKVVLNYKNEYTGEESFAQDPHYELRQKEFKQKLEAAIASLTQAQREVFLLNRIDGKKYREIATMLNVSQKAVEKRMSGALKALREKIPNI